MLRVVSPGVGSGQGSPRCLLDLARVLLREAGCVWAVAAAELQEIVSAESGLVLLYGHTYQRAFRIRNKSSVPFVALSSFCTLEDHWGVEHNLAIPGGSIHALNFLNIHSGFSVSVEPKLLLGEALLGCFLELSLN